MTKNEFCVPKALDANAVLSRVTIAAAHLWVRISRLGFEL